MLAKIQSMGLLGINAYPIEVEVYVTKGSLPKVTLVGLPDASVKESTDRVRAALKNSGFKWPVQAITVNLAPADRQKEGPAFELPIALGILEASDGYTRSVNESYAVVGELALDGSVREVNGCLSMATRARDEGYEGIIVPMDNAREAGVVRGIDVIPVNHLLDAVGFLSGTKEIGAVKVDHDSLLRRARSYDVDFAEVQGQEQSKRALEVAAAGGHNALMIGPPGAGKSMLAHRVCTILPNLDLDESLETTKIYSASGLLDGDRTLMATRPFRTPHHTVSGAGLIGGGSNPRPGEISLAHNGILFLDELPEFSRSVLESLRQPLEDEEVTISRAKMTVSFPSRFMLIAAMNPCPCGFYRDNRRECRCSVRQIEKYRRRISGPFLDRIDIHVDVPPVSYRELATDPDEERSRDVRGRVVDARQKQSERFAEDDFHTNASMRSRHVREFCEVDNDGEGLLRQAMDSLGLSARAYHKVLKVARTIADLDDDDFIRAHHVSEAVNYRSLDRELT